MRLSTCLLSLRGNSADWMVDPVWQLHLSSMMYRGLDTSGYEVEYATTGCYTSSVCYDG